MPTVGYLQGIDPLILTRLAVRGVGTLPISNGFDNHGKFINAITERDEVDLIVGYLHKVLRTQRQGFPVMDILDACAMCHIPVLIIVPEEDQETARIRLGRASAQVELLAPERVYDEIAARLHLPV
ncbi:MAG: hypothetical protein JXA09_12230 [Anaerolineae bacterium]|nr:hypothetical protein [Anaerolineae bacterium]